MQCIQAAPLRLALLGCRIQPAFLTAYTASSRKSPQLTRPLLNLGSTLPPRPRPFSTSFSAPRARSASTPSAPYSNLSTSGSATPPPSSPSVETIKKLETTYVNATTEDIIPHTRGDSTPPPGDSIPPIEDIAPPTASITPPPPSATPTITPTTPLTWNTFLHLRRIRRRYNLLSSVATSALSLTLSTTLLASQNLDVLSKSLFGLDPFIVIGIWTSAFLAVGWLIGPLVGSTVFKLVYRGKVGGQAGVAELRSKERDFFDRIRKHRVDPATSSMQNPVPDYYGEKIVSVQGYRAWLKDQRAFNKKRRSFV